MCLPTLPIGCLCKISNCNFAKKKKEIVRKREPFKLTWLFCRIVDTSMIKKKQNFLWHQCSQRVHLAASQFPPAFFWGKIPFPQVGT